jgi:hypothetical protein
MNARKKTLVAAVDGLERALATDAVGREKDWAARVGQALGRLEQAVRDHDRALAASGGRLVEVDRPLLPSPTVDRRTEELRRELDGVLKEAQALRARVMGAAQGAAGGVNPSGLAGAREVAPEAGAAADFGVFCQRARHLLEALHHYEEQETDLVQHSVTTDIGAGD